MRDDGDVEGQEAEQQADDGEKGAGGDGDADERDVVCDGKERLHSR